MVKPLIIALFLLSALSVQAENLCKHLPELFATASKLRELPQKGEVKCIAENQKQVKGFILSEIKRKLKKDQLKNEGEFLKLIGFFPKELNYEKTLVDLYVSQVAGYYDATQKRFVMAAWIPYELQAPIVVHELTHALQDQHFNLDQFVDMKVLNSDQQLARATIIEGDATTLMLDYTLRQATGKGIKEASAEQLATFSSAITDSVSKVDGPTRGIEKIMVFPYSEGVNLILPIVRDYGYENVDKLFANPPVSTEAILHYGKSDEVNLKIETPSSASVIAEVLSKGYKKYYSDTYGEFIIRTWLEVLGASKAQAEKASIGWGSDILILAEHKKSKKRQAVWYTAWDSERDANEFFSVVSPLLQKLAKTKEASEIKLQKKGKQVYLISDI